MLIVFLCMIGVNSQAQQPKSAPKKPTDKKIDKKAERKAQKAKEPKSARAVRREARQNWRQMRRNEWIEKKKIKDHAKKIQSKDVLRRMARHRNKADRINANRRDPFYVRWFK